MQIITWNINRFDGTYDWFGNKKDLDGEERKDYAKRIIEKLSVLIRNEDDIAILQEFPYKKLEGDEEWELEWKHIFEEKFKVMFWFYDNLRQDFNYNSKNVTIAVAAKESNWELGKFDKRILDFGKYKNKWNYVNRYIELYNGSMSLLGVHLNNTDEQVKQIRKAANDKKFTFIVGDFNVNEQKKESKGKLEKLRRNYSGMIDGNITQNQADTSIDNIFIENSFARKSNTTDVFVWDDCFIKKAAEKRGEEEKKRYSDHNICICKIDGV